VLGTVRWFNFSPSDLRIFGEIGVGVIDKVVASADDAVRDVVSGSSLAVGGFGLAGVPQVLIQALIRQGADRLTLVSNNCGSDGSGLGLLLEAGRIESIVASYIGENREFARQFLAGEIRLELTPQGTLAERLRAGGAGIGGFYTPTGVGTLIAEGGVPWRYARDGSVLQRSPAKEVRIIDGREMVLELALATDIAFVRAAKADRTGNAVFHSTARNFNPVVAMAGRVTILEAEELVAVGQIDPDEVHLPGIFVQLVVPLTRKQAEEKIVEKPTTRRIRGVGHRALDP
jgi:3-oxoacid CoA-transferase subunit A